MEKTKLSARDERFRQFALTGSIWLLLWQVGAPLALYEGLSQLFKILDSLMASHIGASSVSAVAYLAQINMTLGALGGGLAMGGSIKISASYGAGDYDMVKKQVNNLLSLCALLAGLVLLLIPFSAPLLRLAGTPPELISEGSRYFMVELVALALTFFNNVYIAVERARGGSRRILLLNFAVMLVKLGLTALFVYGFGFGITMIGVATVAGQLVLFCAGIYNLSKEKAAFGIALPLWRLRGKICGPILHVSFPVIVEKVTFSLGKVLVNSMSTLYGVLTVGALGISNNLGGITTSPQTGFQSGGASLISQNLGAGKPLRALEAFFKLLAICIGIGAVGWGLTRAFLPQLATLFDGGDPAFAQMIADVYRYESDGLVPLGIAAAVMALLYGFGYTRLTLALNVCRIFVFRIPVLWALQHFTALGSESVGVMMMVSNVSVGVMSLVAAWLVVRRVCDQQGLALHELPSAMRGTAKAKTAED